MKSNVNKSLKKMYKNKRPLDDLPHVIMYFMGGIIAIFIILMFTVKTASVNLWLTLILVFIPATFSMLGFIPMLKQASPVFDGFSVGIKDSLDQINPAYSFPLVTNQGTRYWNIYLGGGYNAFAFSVKGRQVILVPKEDVIEHGASVVTFNTGKFVSISELPQTMQREILTRIPNFDPDSKIWYLALAPRVELVKKFNALYGQESAELSVADMQQRELIANKHSSIMTSQIEEERDMTHSYKIKRYKKDTDEIINNKQEEKFDA